MGIIRIFFEIFIDFLYIAIKINEMTGDLLTEEQEKDLVKRLNQRQVAFAHYYIIKYNKTQAALDAGYSKHTARSIGSELSYHPDVSRYIRHLQASKTIRLKVYTDQIIAELAKIAFFDLGDLLEYKDGEVKLKDFADIRDTAPITQLKVTALTADGTQYGTVTDFRADGKLKALEILAKHTDLVKEPESNQQIVNNNIIINHRKKGEPIERQKEKQ